MTIRLLTIISVISYLVDSQAFAQKKPQYAEAIILTKAGDTLLCYVSMQIDYRNRIDYRTSLDEDPETIRAEEINQVVTENRILESVPVGDRAELMTLVVSGQVNLYNSVSITDTRSSTNFSSDGISTEVSYIVKKNRLYREVRKSRFKKDIVELFNDCPAIIQKVAQKDYGYLDMEAIVREYNECGV